jgi:tetratricopeptide (TPR) repeat protein
MIARVFARMFDQRPITPYEAKELCAAMLTAARSLPASAAFREEYLWTYQSINHRLTGSSPRPSVLTRDVNSSLLHRSHDLALEILQTAEETIREGRDAAWLIDSLADARGWLVTNYALKHGSFARTSIKYLNYVFPAVRLALVAVGMDYRMDDLAGQLLLEREQSHEMMSGYNHALDMENLDEGVRQRARVAAEEQLQRTPRDEQLWGWYGHLLLRLDCLDEAAAALERSLKMRSCVASNRAPILYNLACAYARLDREEDCRRTLEEHIQIEPLDPEWIAQDRDMDSVRGSAWFESLLKTG